MFSSAVMFITFKFQNWLHLAGMEQRIWDERYASNNSVYGLEPNQFFKSFIDSRKAGRILLPAEGEGRNALYAASKGWEVDAFDFSEVARKKALDQAAERGLKINYVTSAIEAYKIEKFYDAVGLIYVHVPAPVRNNFHNKVYKSLTSGGYVVLEAFAKEQIHNHSGGPKDISLLYDAPTICADFQFLHILYCGQKEIILNEGDFHKGKAEVLQMIGQKL